MSCYRAFEIDLEDLLVDPESAEYREFEAHCEGCADCAGELALQRGLLTRLKGEDPPQVEHPADALLLRLARNPDKLPDAERVSLRAHLRDCPPCHDAYRATLMLVPEPQLSALAQVAETLRRWLVPSALPAWAPVAIAVMLVIGVTLQLDSQDSDTPPAGSTIPGVVLRGVPSDAALEVEVVSGERASLSLYGLASDDVVVLRLELPAELRDTEVRVRIAAKDRPPIFEGLVAWDPDDESGGFIEPRAGTFERGSYRIEVTPESGAPWETWLDVR